jgi:hypothetical protein
LFGFQFGHHINSSKHLVTKRFGRLAGVTAPSARHCRALGGHGRLLACRSAWPVVLASCGRTLWCPRPLVHLPCHVRPRAAPAAMSAVPVLKEEASTHSSSLVLPLRSLSLPHAAARAAHRGHRLCARVECSCSSTRPLHPAHRPSSLLASRSGRLLPPRAPDNPCRAAPPSSCCPVCVRDRGATGHPWPCH